MQRIIINLVLPLFALGIYKSFQLELYTLFSFNQIPFLCFICCPTGKKEEPERVEMKFAGIISDINENVLERKAVNKSVDAPEGMEAKVYVRSHKNNLQKG